MQLNFFGPNSEFIRDVFYDADGAPVQLELISETSREIVLYNPETDMTWRIEGLALHFNAPRELSPYGTFVAGVIDTMHFEQGGVLQATIGGMRGHAVKLANTMEYVQRGELIRLGLWFVDDTTMNVDATAAESFQMTLNWYDLIWVHGDPVIVQAQGTPGRYNGGGGDDMFLLGTDLPTYTVTSVLGTRGNDTYDLTGTGPMAYYGLDFLQVTGPLELTANGVTNTGGVLGPAINHTILGTAEAMYADGLGLFAGTGNDIFNITVAEGQFIRLRGFEGNDTFNLDLSSYAYLEYLYGAFALPTTGIVADLTAGTIEDGLGYTDQITYLTDGQYGIELAGTAMSDLITGSFRDESFLLFGGQDTVDGGGGEDRLRLSVGTYSDVQVDLAAGTATGFWNGQAFSHSIRNIEWVSGSEAADTLLGSAQDDILAGYGDDDLIVGLDGEDSLYGFAGNDTLMGGAGGGYLSGGEGDDLLDTGSVEDYEQIDAADSGAGNDTVMVGGGGPGYVYVTNRFLDAGVVVDVDGATGTAEVDKGAQGLTTILGADVAMAAGGLGIYGTGQDDTFNVTAADGGLIVLSGGAGNDVFNIGASGGIVDLFFRSADLTGPAGNGIRVDLAAGMVLDDGTGGQDVINGIGNARIQINATGLADTLLGSGFDDLFAPRGGDDIIDGRGGVDLVLYDRVAHQSGVSANLTQGVATGIYDGTTFRHSLTNIEHLRGGSYDDMFIGSAGTGETFEGGGGFDVLIGADQGLFHIVASAEIYRLYDTVFGREPGVAGHHGWVQKLASGAKTLQEIAAAFVASPEFQGTYGDATDADFVTLLYANVLARAPSLADRDYWVGRLETDLSRERVVLLFSETPEHRSKTAIAQQSFDDTRDITNWADDVFRLYRAVFDRDPEESGFQGWTQTLASGNMTLPEVIESFMGAPEFQSTYGDTTDTQFVTLLYRNVLKRGPDPNGLSSWLDALDNGMERSEVVGLFMASAEFVANTDADLMAYIQSHGMDDHLDPGAGDGLMSGGLYMDSFVFINDGQASTVTVTDLEIWDDLHFDGFGLTGQQVLDAMVQTGNDVVFSDDGETVILADTNLADITLEMILVG
ncbi:bifunctional hemolysin/adenylate cyclase [Antarctobacter heliothermus]|uniref:Bifunctional hemolysin/adenylate cyclase n=2 Tax=Antarctobacter heliothermus TaxID=74033 RepID=A0A222E940_9RHOB|nr:bifunctional hemolysin/adenylate cyclase [Antarctobacter heliothermus]